jgi:uncharacterized protein
MNKIRDILNELKWRKKYVFDDVQIYYIHRGAPNNTKMITGSEIISIGKTFLQTVEALIPHHRIFRIIYQKKLLFDRKRDT